MSALLLTACGGGNNGGSNNPSGISVAISPTTARVEAGRSITLTVNLKNTGVTWPAASDVQGTFTAPSSNSTIWTPPETAGDYEFTVKAASDLSKTATTKITVYYAAPEIAISPTTAEVEKGKTFKFDTTITLLVGQPAQEPVWNVSPTSCGTINQSGLFTAGNTEGNCTVSASLVDADGVNVTSAAILKIPKQAIYVLPGYMGSRLYDSNNNEAWLDKSYILDEVISYMLPFGSKGDTLFQTQDGSGSKVHARPGIDRYGVPPSIFGGKGTYEPLVTNLLAEFRSKYDVVFFPYNWLGDLNDSSTALAYDINDKGYDKVTFVTHSTGGLLAATYIASSENNRHKVKRAVMIAPPLLGTYSALQPLETGDVANFNNEFIDAIGGTLLDILGTISGIYSWIQEVAKNSPTTYQLLPSAEYLKQVTLIYDKAAFAYNDTPVISADRYYEILNGSFNINPKLTNGNNRSHKYHRDTVLQGNIADILKQVDTILIGSDYGNPTPALVAYNAIGGTSVKLEDIYYSMNGDGTVLNISAQAKDDATGILPYKDFANIGHKDLVSNSDVLNYVAVVIRGDAMPLTSASAMAIRADESGMSEFLKINVTAVHNVDIAIVDAKGKTVASVVTGLPKGFDKVNFIYDSFADTSDATDASIYLPNGGYKVVFTSGAVADAEINLSARVAMLDYDGSRTATATYEAAKTGENGVALTLDMIGNAVTKETLGTMGSGTRP
jgi:hypothetical protein